MKTASDMGFGVLPWVDSHFVLRKLYFLALFFHLYSSFHSS